MSTNEFIEKSRLNISILSKTNEEDIVMVWYNKTIQNHKAIFFVLSKQDFYEVTYNGDKNEMYFDKYKKTNKITMEV